MIATNTAKNLTLKTNMFFVWDSSWELKFYVKINMKKRYHNSILRNTVNFNHFSLNTISELQEGLQKRHTLLMM